MTISLITRSNTVDEWRIQGNEEAIQLNLLETGEYTKSNGVLYFTGNSSLVMTSNGTSLSVSNNALIGGSLEIGDELLVGTDGTGSGNGQFFGTLQVRGPGQAFNVSNSAYVTNNISIGKTTYTGNLIVNTSATFSGDATVDGILRLDNNQTALYVNTGSISVNTGIFTDNLISGNAYLSSVFSDEVTTSLLTADAADILNGQILSGNVYYLQSNTIYGYEGTIARFTSNVSANIVNLTSDTANINAATVLDLTADGANISYANIETLLSNVATLNTSTLGNTTVTGTADIDTAVIDTLTATDAEVTNLVANDLVAQTGNIVSLISNQTTINTSTLLRTTITNADISTANVTSKVNVQNGSILITRTSDNYDALVVAKGISRVKDTVVEGNLTVSGAFTQTGNINFEIDAFYLNADTPINKDASIINQRPIGNNATILWNESNDRWEISTGNTWSSTYKILDGADIYTGVDSTSTTLVASASAVKFAYEAGGVVAGGYANAAYRHANSAYVSQNTTGVYANTGYTHANAAFDKANVANSLAQIAFDAANVAYVAGGTIAGSYANSAFIKANTPSHVANSASSYANGAFITANAAYNGTIGTHTNVAFSTANSAVIAAAVADGKAVTANNNANTAGVYANAAFARANLASSNAASASSYANSAFAAANTKLSLTGGTISGSLTVTGSFNAAGASILANELKIADGIITLNSDLLQSASPNENIGIEVERGASPNVYVLWNETTDKWTLTNDGTNYYNIVTTNDIGDLTTNALDKTGDTMTGELLLSYDVEAAASSAAVSKDYVDTQLIAIQDSLTTVNLSASQIGSGTLSTDRLAGTYGINVSGYAASLALGSLTSVMMKNVQTIRILDSSGTTLKTIYTPGE